MPDALAPFLTPAWCERVNDVAAALPELEGATGVVEVSIRRVTGVTGVFTASYREGRVTQRMGPDPQANVRVEFEEEEFKALLLGQFDGLEAYATGRIRVTGDLDTATRVFPLLDTEAYRAHNRRVLDFTAFD